MNENDKIAMERALAARNTSGAKSIIARNRALSGGATGDHTRADEIALKNMARSEMSRGEAALHGFNQGSTMGFADEMIGGLGGDTAEARRRLEVARTAYPGMTTVAQVAGSAGSPVTAVVAPVSGVKGAVAVAGATGALQGAGEAEGDLGDRAAGALKGGATGLFFGGMTAGLTRGASNGIKRLVSKEERRPTLQGLRAIKDDAYSAVRRSGFKFSEDDLIDSWSRLDDLAKDPRWDIDGDLKLDEGAIKALNIMRKRAESGDVSLNNLDKTRQSLWDTYNRTDHPFVLQAIEEIDNLIAKNANGNELMNAARLANSRHAKAALLENAFKKARLQTASTGSGGNILNKYRQAVTSILNKPHEAKWFSQEELAVMENFVLGDNAENVLRRVGKLAPGGNGLMTALNVYGASVDPSLLAVTAAATAAKGAADKGAMRGSEELLDAVSTGVISGPQPQGGLGIPAVAGATAGNELLR